MDLTRILELLSIGAIIMAVITPIMLAIAYWKSDKLGRLHAWNFLGESYSMFITLFFAIVMWLGFLDDLPEWAQALARISMATATITVTYRLHKHYWHEILGMEVTVGTKVFNDITAYIKKKWKS